MRLDQRNRRTLAAGIKLGVFTVVSVIVTGVLAVIMGHVGFGSTNQYHAIFTNASSLTKGDDVRIAGVSVGKVESVDHYAPSGGSYDQTGAEVTFKVDSSVTLTKSTVATVRYLDLVGNRYLSLTQGSVLNAATLPPGGTIECNTTVCNTVPAIDLTTLFDGFQPLFNALQPSQVNQLTFNLIQTFQGEGGTVQSLLARTASLTTTLANHDQLIGDVITDLNTTLGTVDSRRAQLDELITQLDHWLTDLAHDRGTIGQSIAGIATLSHVVAGFLHQGRPLLKGDIGQLRRLGKLLNQPKNKAQIQEIFDRLPESMTDQTRTGTYGSWYSYYVCGVGGSFKLPKLPDIPVLNQLTKQLTNFQLHSNATRCLNHGGSSDPTTTTSTGGGH